MPLTLEEALKECSPHPADGTVLVTGNPEALIAIRDPEIKAIELVRTLPTELVDALETVTFADTKLIRRLYDRDSDTTDILNKDRRIRRKTLTPEWLEPWSNLPQKAVDLLVADMSTLSSHFTNAVGSQKSSGCLTNYPSIGRKIHTDNLRSSVYDESSRVEARMHVTYISANGLEWIPGEMTLSNYVQLGSVTSDNSRPADLRTTFSRVGCPILFKAANSGFITRKEGIVPGFVHVARDRSDSIVNLVGIIDNYHVS